MQHTYWLIWSTEHKGWWKPNHKGYTQDLTEAGVYEYQEAANIVYGANIGLLYNDTAVPNESMILLEGELEEKVKIKVDVYEAEKTSKDRKNKVWYQRYQLVKGKPIWATINFSGDIIKEEEYTHQDKDFSNVCLSQYCRCRD